MNKITTSIVSFLLGFSVIASASADSTVYTTAYGGLNWDNVTSAPFVDNETGSVVGLTLGKTVAAVPGLRVELDVSERVNDVNVFGGLLTAKHNTTALMVNGVYDFPVELLAGGQPYVLGGLGVARSEFTFEDVSLLKLENTELAYQLGTGINWKVADGVKAGVGYRYFAGPDVNVLNNEVSDGTDNSVIATVSFDLN